MGLFDLLKQNAPPATSMYNMNQLTEAEMAALKFEQMKRQMDEMSRMRQMTEAYGMNPNAVMNMQQMNPMGNTMQNIPANVGGMSARNAQPPMDINTLLRMIGYR
jgi:signal recognition particle GTPase